MSSLDKEKSDFDVAGYWEERYRSGRDSGSGSYDRLAKYKADFINEFIEKKSIKSATELGCGDGNQLALINYPNYIGLDISQTVVDKCRSIFNYDSSKDFHLYDPDSYNVDNSRSELALSLDVIYHLSNDDVYFQHLNHLFSSARRFVIIYSNSQSLYMGGVDEEEHYVRFRKFEKDIEKLFPEWDLVDIEPNFYPFNPSFPDKTSFADFYVYAAKSENEIRYQDKDSTGLSFISNKLLNRSRISDEQSHLIFEQFKGFQKKSENDFREVLKKLDNIERKQIDSEIIELKKELEIVHRNNKNLTLDLNNIKNSTRYQLGYHFIRAVTSWRGAVGLPLALYRLASRRKSQKKSPENHKSKQQPITSNKQSVFSPPSEKAAEISILGWPDYPPNGKPYVIGIMDEFTGGCFGEDLNLIQPRPDNWFALAEKYKPELIFIESAWKGNFGSWQYRVGDYANKPGQEVAHIAQYAREKGIPTVFWNKEDPVHHEKFMGSAKLVDYIFTTDANMKASYQAKTSNHNVHALPFAAQPALHKPATLAGRKPLSCFAGSWYGNRHAERGDAMRWLLKAADKYGLEIYDRNYGTGIFPFPDEYQDGIKGSLPYKDLCNEYNRYRVFLNVNSVTDSPTMFSRRVFELMACGTPVVSTYAKGIEHLFESDAVWMVKNELEAEKAIHTLMTNDAEWRRRSLAGIREVFSKHTYAHRLNEIFAHVDIETRIPTNPAIQLLAQAESQAELKAFINFANNQQYPSFHVGIECPSEIMTNVKSLPGSIELIKPGDMKRWVIEKQQDYPLAGWLSAANSYGDYYLQDLANASHYEPEASVWAKAIDRDRFAYNGLTMQSAALWKANAFLNEAIDKDPLSQLEAADLYLVDTDEFHKDNGIQQGSKL